MVRQGNPVETSVYTCTGVSQKDGKAYHNRDTECYVDARVDKVYANNLALEEDKSKSETFELYKRRTTIVVRRKYFLDVVCEALSEYKYVGPNQRADLVIACRYSSVLGPSRTTSDDCAREMIYLEKKKNLFHALILSHVNVYYLFTKCIFSHSYSVI